MAKVSLKGIPEIERRIQRTFGKIKTSKQMNMEIGDFTIKRIRAEARRAKPLNDTRTFPPLKESSKVIREALATTNDTHPTFKVNRSNLTFSGQLIDAIFFRIKQDGTIVIGIADSAREQLRAIVRSTKFKRGLSQAGVTGFAKGAITKKLLKPGGRKTNREVDKNLRKRGFFLYTAKGIDSEPRIKKRINNIVKKFVRRAIKANFE